MIKSYISVFLLLHLCLACRNSNPNIYTFAGNGYSGNLNDNGLATSASISQPAGLVGDSSYIYISSQNGHVIRSVNKVTNYIKTIAGITSNPGRSGDGGPASSATLRNPTGLCIDFKGNIIIADRCVEIKTLCTNSRTRSSNNQFFFRIN